MSATVSILEAARLLEVTDKTIRNYIKRGFLEPEKWNGMWQIPKSQLLEVNQKKNGTRVKSVVSGFSSEIGLSKDEYSEQMIRIGTLQAYKVQLGDQKDEMEKLNARIAQLEASSASGWTEARSVQHLHRCAAEELEVLRKEKSEQQEELVWLRREKNAFAQRATEQAEINRKLLLRLRNLEDQLHAQAILS